MAKYMRQNPYPYDLDKIPKLNENQEIQQLSLHYMLNWSYELNDPVRNSVMFLAGEPPQEYSSQALDFVSRLEGS